MRGELRKYGTRKNEIEKALVYLKERSEKYWSVPHQRYLKGYLLLSLTSFPSRFD
jgi:hypothetical protein